MAGIVSRRPLTGVAAGLIIGALGLLLIGIDTHPAAGRSIAAVLFKVAGWLFLFVSAMAFLGAFQAFRNTRLRRGGARDTRGRAPGEG
jgi:hypothetical protein